MMVPPLWADRRQADFEVSLAAAFDEAANAYASRIAVDTGEQRINYKQLQAAADRLALQLIELGCTPADRVAILMARADMAAGADSMTSELGPPILAIADAHRGEAFDVDVELDGAPPVSAPADMIEAVVETLVENSRQAGARQVRIAASADGDRVRLAIADDGPGVPPADHERIFEPFHTGRRDQGGSGLGLSIARSLLAASGGTIVSKPAAKGALFEICLPAAR